MEAKELMIKDYVTLISGYDKGAIIQVEDISDENEINVSFDGNGECLGGISCDRIAPIPLTEEILLANGFEIQNIHDKKEHCIARLKEYNFTVECWFEKSQCIWYYCFVNYVHELQHALRLCGLSDLADNFKIK